MGKQIVIKRKGHAKKVTKEKGLISVACNLLSAIFALAGLIGWFGAIGNNPMAKHITIFTKLASVLTPLRVIVFLIIITGVLIFLNVQGKFKNDIANFILIALVLSGITWSLSFKYFATATTASFAFTPAIALYVLSVIMTRRENNVDYTSYAISLGVGSFISLLIKFMMKLTWGNWFMSVIWGAIALLSVYYTQDTISKSANEITMQTAIKAVVTIPQAIINKALKILI